ncbi:DUF4342 domain-containing protein [Peptacetobacter hominis]|uniref:DUF4342 domain-containing protein n=1 Tax=Peptacetobacter hominis TaxID=2743610 RepID=A0A544QYM5_9FIRM|nr:DUF4342 domain-containing protein [Peptacetobacter hominis]TQQ85738.1 DUF4342 domain-containing protein [Peptacetobacter hominis]
MSNTITIEMVDQVMERVPYATYKEVKEALVKSEGDVLDAIILLEEETYASKAKKKVEDIFGKSKEDIKDARENAEKAIPKDINEIKAQLKELFSKTNQIRVIVEKDGKSMMNIPFTIGVMGTAIMPMITLLGLSAALITKYRVKIQNESDGNIVDLGELNEEKVKILKDIFLNTANDIKETFAAKEEEEDDKDVTDDLMKEYDEVNEEK